MWIVAKLNYNQEFIFKNSLREKISDVKFYIPKIKIALKKKNKILYKEKSLVDNYIFCYSKKFLDKNLIQIISNTRGLNYFLGCEKLYQKEINDFIIHCKYYEDEKGFIKSDFIDISLNKLYKFTSGPFINLVFKLIDKNKREIEVLVGNKNIFLKKDLNYSYQLI